MVIWRSSTSPANSGRRYYVNFHSPDIIMSTTSDSLPPIAALFLVVFDKRVGYKIAWERSTDGLELAGVEYRSLASGLHNVQTDLM